MPGQIRVYRVWSLNVLWVYGFGFRVFHNVGFRVLGVLIVSGSGVLQHLRLEVLFPLERNIEHK